MLSANNVYDDKTIAEMPNSVTKSEDQPDATTSPTNLLEKPTSESESIQPLTMLRSKRRSCPWYCPEICFPKPIGCRCAC